MSGVVSWMVSGLGGGQRDPHSTTTGAESTFSADSLGLDNCASGHELAAATIVAPVSHATHRDETHLLHVTGVAPKAGLGNGLLFTR